MAVYGDTLMGGMEIKDFVAEAPWRMNPSDRFFPQAKDYVELKAPQETNTDSKETKKKKFDNRGDVPF